MPTAIRATPHEDLNTKLRGAAEDLRDQAGRVGEQMRDAASVVRDDFEDIAHEAGRELRKAAHKAERHVNDASKSLASRIRKEPLKSSMIALGIGAAIGFILRRK